MIDVILSERAFIHFVNVYSYISGTRVSQVTPIELDIDFLRENKDRIINIVPKTHQSKLRRFIDGIIKNRDKIRAFAELRDSYARTVVQTYLENEIFNGIEFEVYEGDKKVEKHTDTRIDVIKLAEYVPVPVTYKTKNGLNQGYLFLPTERDKKVLKGVNDIEYSLILRSLVIRNAKPVIDEHKIILGNRVYKFSEVEFVKALTSIGHEKEAGAIVAGKIIDRIPENMRGMTRIVHSIVPEVEVVGKAKDMGMKVPSKFEDMIVKITVSSNLWSYPQVILSAHVNHRKVLQGKISVEASIDEIPDKMGSLLKKLGEVVSKYADVTLEVLNAGKKKGFDVSAWIDEDYKNVDDEGIPEMRIAYLLTRGDDEIRLRAENGKLKGRIDTEVDISGMDISEDFIFQKLIERSIPLSRSNISRGGWRVSIAREIESDSINEILEEYKKMKNSINEVIKEYKELKNEVKEKVGKVSIEQLVALYLVEHVTYTNIKTDLLIGRNRAFMYSRIARLAKQLDPSRYEELKNYYKENRRNVMVDGRHNIVDILVSKGYVKLNPEGVVEINGKPMTELLKSINPRWTEFDIYEINNEVAGDILNRIIEYPDKETLEKLGLLTPNIVSLVITKMYSSIDPDILAEKYNGETIWSQLPNDIKRYYISGKATSESLYKMLTTYRDVFKDMESDITLRLVNLDWNRGTKYLAKHRPELISEKDKLQLYDDGFFTGVKMGRFAIQVALMNTLSRYDEKAFVVYDINTKIGMPVSAKTVEEAYEKAENTYNKFIKEFRKLEEISEKNEFVKLWEDSNYNGFKVYTVMVGPIMHRSEYVVAPGVLKKVNKKLEEIEREMKKERERRKKKGLLLN